MSDDAALKKKNSYEGCCGCQRRSQDAIDIHIKEKKASDKYMHDKLFQEDSELITFTQSTREHLGLWYYFYPTPSSWFEFSFL